MNITTPPTDHVTDYSNAPYEIPNPIKQLPNINISENNSPSFLMQSEHPKITPDVNSIVNRHTNIINSDSNNYLSMPLINKNPNKSFTYDVLEAKVDSINEKLNKLENRVGQEEQVTLSTKEDVKDLKSNLDRNFNKLDIILEKLSNKLK